MEESKTSRSEEVRRAQEEWVEARDRQATEAVEERARAETLWRQLQKAGSAADGPVLRGIVLADPQFQSWAFCERLCNESAELADEDTGRAFELAELALELVPRISGDEKLLSGIQEYVWKHLGNVFRARGDLKKAQEAFERAGTFFLGGMSGILPSIILRDRLAALESALHRDQGDLAEALRSIDHAAYSSVGDRASHPAFFLEKARLHRRLGQSEKALQALERTERDLPATAGRLLARIAIERGEILCDLGRPGDVQKLPASLRKVALGFPLEKARLLCLDGRIAAGLGRLADAQAALQTAREAIHERATAHLALLSLEIAALHVRQGQTAELKSLAEQTLPLTGSPRFGREAAATLKLFCRLADQEKLSAERVTMFVRDFAHVPVGQ
jgi:tetratricopeptide (TPR) repeat protein